MKIAMLLDAAGCAVEPEGDGTVYVYRRQGAEWVVERTQSHHASGHDTVASMRGYLNELSASLSDCAALAAKAPRGFARVVFAQAGLALWTIDGASRNDLDRIADFYLRAAAQAGQVAGPVSV